MESPIPTLRDLVADEDEYALARYDIARFGTVFIDEQGRRIDPETVDALEVADAQDLPEGWRPRGR